MSAHDDSLPEFDLSRLNREERELWDAYFARPLREGESELIRVWSFGYACMLELTGPPAVVSEYLEKHDPDNLVRQYLDNVRRARESGR